MNRVYTLGTEGRRLLLVRLLGLLDYLLGRGFLDGGFGLGDFFTADGNEFGAGLLEGLAVGVGDGTVGGVVQGLSQVRFSESASDSRGETYLRVFKGNVTAVNFELVLGRLGNASRVMVLTESA